MLLAKLKMTAVWMLTLALLMTGAGFAAHWASKEEQSNAAQTREPKRLPTGEPRIPEPSKQEQARVDFYGDPLPKGAVARFGTSRLSVRPLDDYELEVTFNDGTNGIFSLKDRLFGPVFEPLRDPAMFRQVFVDDFGAVCWPNGADLAPDALYQKLRAATATF